MLCRSKFCSKRVKYVLQEQVLLEKSTVCTKRAQYAGLSKKTRRTGV